MKKQNAAPTRIDLAIRAWWYEVCAALSDVQAALYNKMDAVILTEPFYRHAVQVAIFIQFEPQSDLHALRQELGQVRPAMDELVHYFHLFAIPEAGMDPVVMLRFHEQFTALLGKLDTLLVAGEEN